MLWQLFLANWHFGLNIFTAFVFFMTGWLYFDAFKITKQTKSDLIRSLGFFLLAIVFIVHATSLTLPSLIFMMQIFKIVALILIALSLIVQSIPHPPQKEAALIFPFMMFTDSLVALSAELLLLIAYLYFRKSTKGQAYEIKPAAIAFLALSLAEFINIAFLAAKTSIVIWSKMLSEYGFFWNISHLLQFLAMVILGLWTWKYLRFKVDRQLFITIISASLLIFIATTATFTFLLLRNLEANTLSQLKVNAGVMQYALERLKSEALADAKSVVQNNHVQNAYLEGNDNKLYELTSQIMLTQKTNFLTVVNADGKVVTRAQDRDKVGDSLWENPIFKSAITGLPLVTVEAKKGAIIPQIEVAAAESFINNTGVVITGFSVDNAFVDGIKQTTGLDTSVYSQDTRVATTFIAPDHKSRFVGTKETNEKILSTVLKRGEIFTGPVIVLNQPFYAAFSPLKNNDGKNIGMLFVGKPQTELFEAAQRSTQLTFAISALFILLSIAPAYFISRYIKENIQA